MQKEDVLVDTLSTLVRLADGEGFMGHSGLWGDRGIEGRMMFVMIGAIVQVPPNVYKILSALGPKIYFHRPEFKEATEEDLMNAIIGEEHESKKAAMKDTLFSYLTWLEVNPALTDLDRKIGQEGDVLTPEDEEE
jgi:hypothetical protein